MSAHEHVASALRGLPALCGPATVAWAGSHADPLLHGIGLRALHTVGLSCGGARDIAAE